MYAERSKAASPFFFVSVASHQFAWQHSLFLHLFSSPPWLFPSGWCSIDVSHVNIFQQNTSNRCILILAACCYSRFIQTNNSVKRERERAIERNGSGRYEPHFLLSTPQQQPLDNTSGCDVLLPKFPFFASVYTSEHFGAKIVNERLLSLIH